MGMTAGGSDELNSEINVTPLVDVMLVLLIIFMITAPMMNRSVDLDLPDANASSIEDPEGPLKLQIDASRHVYLGGTPVPWAKLKEKLQKNERVQKEQRLYIEADQKLEYGLVIVAMALAKEAGVAKVMMVTEPAKTVNVEDLDRPTP